MGGMGPWRVNLAVMLSLAMVVASAWDTGVLWRYAEPSWPRGAVPAAGTNGDQRPARVAAYPHTEQLQECFGN